MGTESRAAEGCPAYVNEKGRVDLTPAKFSFNHASFILAPSFPVAPARTVVDAASAAPMPTE
jgi:hypothetical protein